ncbi:MAG: 4-(cytidine 5'-diphospho)-2-C-methyl-D-erythritol kinase [Chloroflexota bacterium]|nr:4-(cytidine 5'-diphospho)-2-C-methyl-D-erythritol kinase [Chloroflexota bacterium]
MVLAQTGTGVVAVHRCYAKINLSLEVVGRRDDGYHELASIAHTISLADDLRIELADHVATRVEGPRPVQDSLVTRAAHLLAAASGCRRGARLTLLKRIPASAGLGGGSSDAATTLVGLNELWQTGLDDRALAGLAAQLGSDVPFFLRGGAASIRGRGEELSALPPLAGQWLVLAVLEDSLPDKTGTLYRALCADDFSAGATTAMLEARLRRHEVLVESLLINAFERAARRLFPGLDGTWNDLERLVGRPFHLSGAGPALYALAGTRAEARQFARAIQRPGLTSFAARTVTQARAAIRNDARACIEYP